MKDSGREFITIEWSAPKDDGGAPITGYNIERKDKRTNRWTPVASVEAQKVCYTYIYIYICELHTYILIHIAYTLH